MQPLSTAHRILIGVVAGVLFWSVASVAGRALGTGSPRLAAYAAVIVGVGTAILVN